MAETESAAQLFAYCEKCETLFLHVCGAYVDHACGNLTGQIVRDSNGIAWAITTPADMVRLDVKLAKRVVRFD